MSVYYTLSKYYIYIFKEVKVYLLKLIYYSLSLLNLNKIYLLRIFIQNFAVDYKIKDY